MNLETLKYFHDVVSLKSISKAATASHISQSALSQKLNKLEDSLGIVALIRSNKGVELTPEGEILYSYSKKLLDEYYKLESDLNNVKTQRSNLTLETSGLAGSYILPKILDKISSHYTNLTYSALYKYPTNIEVDLVNNLCDIVISTLKLKDSTFKSIYLGSDELICISRTHSSPILSNTPFLLLEDEHNIESKLHNIIDFNDIKIRTNSLHTIITLLTTTHSVAVLPRLCVTEELKSGLFKEIDIPILDKNFDLYISYKIDTLAYYKDAISFITKIIKNIIKSS